jgi:myo-inositol-1(or 4)-monophosphatase
MPAHGTAPTQPDFLRDLRLLAEGAARAGGAVARAAFGGALSVRCKSDGSEVTDADEAAQAAVIACLDAQRPGDALLAEETLAGAEQARRPTPANNVVSWIIDPIDGTRNYVRGVPLYAVSVAAMFGGLPRAGAIYVPDRDDMYSASEPEGVLLNGQPIPPPRPLTAAPGRPAKPLVGIPSSLHGAAYDLMQSWIPRVIVRNLGSTAMHLAMVAAGQLQAALSADGRLWDIAAGWLLVKCAGGRTTGLGGGDVFPIDLATYAGEPIPTVAAHDAALHARLLAGTGAADSTPP